jgi:hypothetical protein
MPRLLRNSLRICRLMVAMPRPSPR